MSQLVYKFWGSALNHCWVIVIVCLTSKKIQVNIAHMQYHPNRATYYSYHASEWVIKFVSLFQIVDIGSI